MKVSKRSNPNSKQTLYSHPINLSLDFENEMMRITLISLCAVMLIALLQTDASDYHDAGLKLHNSYRRTHNSPPMRLDSNLNALAAKCAKHYAAKGRLGHDCPVRDKSKQGENLSISTKKSVKEAVEDATKRWYNEVKEYSYRAAKFVKGTGHFTQLVWKDSTKLGIGVYQAKWKGYDAYFVVALYNPPGNFDGEFTDNVKPKSS